MEKEKEISSRMKRLRNRQSIFERHAIPGFFNENRETKEKEVIFIGNKSSLETWTAETDLKEKESKPMKSLSAVSLL